MDENDVDGDGEKQCHIDDRSKIEISLDSENMDPKQVLFGSDDIVVKIPVPEAKIFNNLDEYYKHTFFKKLKNQNDNNKDSSIISTLKNIPPSLENFDMEKSNKKKLTDVIQKMKINQGPLTLLYISINKKIKVLIRRRKLCVLYNERFAWLTGLLVAFDKHFNLVLKDTLETFHYQIRNSNEFKIINKQSKQIFIRGDNIILITQCN